MAPLSTSTILSFISCIRTSKSAGSCSCSTRQHCAHSTAVAPHRIHPVQLWNSVGCCLADVRRRVVGCFLDSEHHQLVDHLPNTHTHHPSLSLSRRHHHPQITVSYTVVCTGNPSPEITRSASARISWLECSMSFWKVLIESRATSLFSSA